MHKKKIVFTGGHHSSALPLIAQLQQNYPEIELIWFGHRHTLKNDKNDTLEYKQITSLGIKFYELHAGKLYKTYNLMRLIKIPFGFLQALYLLATIKPDLIFSFGGYLAVPTVLAGFLLNIPSVTHEQTLVVGYANKLIAKFAKKAFISWPQSEQFFDRKKLIYSGLPLRLEISYSQSNDFVIKNTLPTIYITAGKTGSHKFNTVINAALPELLNFCNIIHQTGDYSLYNDYEQLVATYAELKQNLPGHYFPRKFIFDNEIGEVFSKSALVVSRAGAHILSELLALEKPAILIPIPWVSHNEQNINAQFMLESGLSVVLAEDDLTNETLTNIVQGSLINIDNFKLKDTTYRNYIKKDSTQILLSEVLKILNSK